MVRTVTYHECDVCRRRFTELADAQECEAQPPPIEYPIGVIHGDHEPGTMYHNCTFALARNNINAHSNVVSLWACRDNGYGDSLGDETCGSPNAGLNHVGTLDPKQPHFQRMVQYIRSRGWSVTVLVPHEHEGRQVTRMMDLACFLNQYHSGMTL